MGREVRRVPPNWQHPSEGAYSNGGIAYKPLFGGPYSRAAAEWDEGAAQWADGLRRDWANGGWKPRDGSEEAMTYEEWDGERPVPEEYMPEWSEEEATHYMMYETTSEGTPISPAFATPEELARWLACNGASAFAGQTAAYEAWLRVCRGGYAPSAVMDASGIRSGVEGISES